MRSFRVVTSQNLDYYNMIGKDCIKSFLQHWPKDISIELWAENFSPDITDHRLIVKDWNKINPRFNDFVALIESTTDNSKVLSRKKFWMKAHVIISALEEFNNDLFIWLDSDVITNNNIPLEYLENLCPSDVLSMVIPAGGKAKDKEIESGFFILNNKHSDFLEFLKFYKEAHTTLKILDMNRYLETSVFWEGLKFLENKNNTKNNYLKIEKDIRVPFMYTELANYMRHWVCPDNKERYINGHREKIIQE